MRLFGRHQALVATPLAIALAFAPCTGGAATPPVDGPLAASEGCFKAGVNYHPPMAWQGRTIEDSGSACQFRCTRTPYCLYFVFWPEDKGCLLADSTAKIVSDAAAMSGPRACEGSSVPATACDERPSHNGFPGKTIAQTMAAWPSGAQPIKNECWPKGVNGSYSPCFHSKVLHGSASGDPNSRWKGKCQQLSQVTIPTELASLGNTEACKTSCQGNPFCANWQSTSDGKCWQGLGYLCENENGGVAQEMKPVVGGQRILHGAVRVLRDLKGLQIMGLTNIFAARAFDVDVIASAQCKEACYSDILCAYWQYSMADGCYVEASSVAQVLYPLALGHGAAVESGFARKIFAGEYIQRYCPDHGPTTEAPPTAYILPVYAEPPTASPAEADSGWMWWLIIGMFIVCLLFGALAGLYFFKCKKTRKKERRTKEVDSQVESEAQSEVVQVVRPLLQPPPVQYTSVAAAPMPIRSTMRQGAPMPMQTFVR